MARPTEYTQDKADFICMLIIEGMNLRDICARDDMPAMTTLFRWLRQNEDFQTQYAQAKEDQAEIMVSDMLTIADDGSQDYYDDDGKKKLNNECVQRSKLRVETRKWAISKFKPKVYGDRIIHAGDEDAPLATTEVTPQEKKAFDRFVKNYKGANGKQTTTQTDDDHSDLC